MGGPRGVSSRSGSRTFSTKIPNCFNPLFRDDDFNSIHVLLRLQLGVETTLMKWEVPWNPCSSMIRFVDIFRIELRFPPTFVQHVVQCKTHCSAGQNMFILFGQNTRILSVNKEQNFSASMTLRPTNNIEAPKSTANQVSLISSHWRDENDLEINQSSRSLETVIN